MQKIIASFSRISSLFVTFFKKYSPPFVKHKKKIDTSSSPVSSEKQVKNFFKKIGSAIFYFIFPKKDSNHIRWSTLLLLALVMGAYFSFGLFHLGKFQTADEDLWYADPTTGRIHEYWHAIENKEWERTRINDKPGVTTAILGYLGYVMDSHPADKMPEDGNIIDRYDPVLYEQTAYYYQLPFVIANGALLILLFWLAYRYTKNDLFALLLTGFTALTPLLIGISQIVNPDATVWSFGFTALMAYLVFLKTTHFRWLFLAIPLFGLALLSKYGTSYIIFFTFFITFVHLFYNLDTFSDRKKYANATIKVLIGWVLFIAGSLGVFALLMPAAILHPEFIYKGTIGFKHAKDVNFVLWSMGILYGIFLFEAIFLRGRALFWLLTKIRIIRQPILILFSFLFLSFATFTLVNWGWHNHFNFKDVVFDAGTGKEFTTIDFYWKPFLELKPLVFTTQPVVLFPALLTLLLLVWRKNRFTFLIFTFVSFIVFFYAAILSQDILVHGRYSVLLYPAMAGLATIGILFVLEKFLKHRWLRSLLIFLLLGVSASSILFIVPYLFNYTNDILPKQQNVTGAWGLGGYEAAQYLNSLPDSDKLILWSDYEGVCPFLKGKCIKGSVVKWYNGGRFSGFDYIVVSRRGKMQNKTTWEKLKDEEKFYPNPVWTLLIGGREGNFVKIYKMKEEFSSSALHKKDDITPPAKKILPKAPVVPAKKEGKKK